MLYEREEIVIQLTQQSPARKPSCPGLNKPAPPPCCLVAACPSPDYRGALRPDVRDCPALGRNFCLHEPDRLRAPGEAAPPECTVTPQGLLVNAASFRSKAKGICEDRPMCVPYDYNEMYCGRSGINFPMYCAASNGVLKPSDCQPQIKKGAASRCRATEPCCQQAPSSFIVRPDSCYKRPCVPPDPPDKDIARRVGGFSQSMPSPTTWI